MYVLLGAANLTNSCVAAVSGSPFSPATPNASVPSSTALTPPSKYISHATECPGYSCGGMSGKNVFASIYKAWPPAG